jgi:hypothetical protein
MRLESILKEKVWYQVKVVSEVLSNGVMDFLLVEDDQHQRFQMLEDLIRSMKNSSSEGGIPKDG